MDPVLADLRKCELQESSHEGLRATLNTWQQEKDNLEQAKEEQQEAQARRKADDLEAEKARNKDAHMFWLELCGFSSAPSRNGGTETPSEDALDDDPVVFPVPDIYPDVAVVDEGFTTEKSSEKKNKKKRPRFEPLDEEASGASVSDLITLVYNDGAVPKHKGVFSEDDATWNDIFGNGQQD